MIYSHKPQRSGRSIAANTNNPPQDPPPPKVLDTVTPPLDNIPKVSHISEIPDIFIEDTTPPVPENCIEPIEIPEKTIATQKKIQKKIPKQIQVSLFRRFITKILRILGRK